MRDTADTLRTEQLRRRLVARSDELEMSRTGFRFNDEDKEWYNQLLRQLTDERSATASQSNDPALLRPHRRSRRPEVAAS